MQNTTYKLKSGREINLPLRYKNWKGMTATFTMPARDAQKLLPAKLKPILLTPGKAMISFSGFEYPQVSDLAPYNEFGITIPVEYEPRISIPFLPFIFNPLFPQPVYKNGANFVYYLPVSTEESFRAGSEIWGYPKVVRKIEFQETETSRICILTDEERGVEEVRLEIEKIPASKNEKSFSYNSYTEKNGRLLLTTISARGRFATKVLGAKASAILKDGEKIRELKGLSISKNPVQVFFAEIIESELPLADDSFPK